MSDAHRAALEEATDHLDRALEHHSNGRHGAVKRAVQAAQGCIDRALKALKPESHDPVANPTAAQGAQVSNGQSPRAYTAEEIRRRDQLNGCQLGYEARLRQMGARR